MLEDTLIVSLCTFIILVIMEFIKPGIVSFRFPLSAMFVELLLVTILTTILEPLDVYDPSSI